MNFGHVEQKRARYFGGARTAGRLTLWTGLGGPLFQPEDRVREEVEHSQALGLPIHMHAIENQAQEPKDALEILDRCGAMGPQLLLAHAIYLRDSDLDLVARTNTKISYNPLSNMRAGGGICRVVEMRAQGIDMSLGIDGSVANDNSDFFTLMRAGLGLQRAHWMRADCLSVDDIVEMATIGGARGLGQEDDTGSLEAGKRADVVLSDPDSVNFLPLNNSVLQLVFCGQPRNVDTVIVDGQVLKHKGEFVGVDLGELLAKSEEAARAIIDKAGLKRDPICLARR